MQKITPFLWFDDQAKEAVSFYTSIFKNGKIGKTARYDKAGAEVSGRAEGSVMTMEFEVEEMKFIALNGGDTFKFSPAISASVNLESVEDLTALWEKLVEGGSVLMPFDKYGVAWQVVPTVLGEFMSDAAKSQKVMEAMLKMVKLDVTELNKVANQI